MADNWMIPVYKEGFTNPFGIDRRHHGGQMSRHHPDMFYQNSMMPFGMPEPGRIMREMEALFPFEKPGHFKPSDFEPSALAPVSDDKKYMVKVNTEEFKPNELTIKTIEREGHNFLVVEGKHETKDEHGYHSVHHFKRQYMVPENVDPETFKSTLNEKGQLTIQAPKNPNVKTIKDRTVPMEVAPRKK